MDGTMDILTDLKEEADILRRKHQRKGVEYKVRQMALRPSITRGGPGDSSPKKKASSPLKGRPGTAPPDSVGGGLSLPSIRGATAAPNAAGATGGAVAAHGSMGGLSLDDYDPRKQQEQEAENLVAELTKLREQASGLHHTIGSLGRKKESLENELEQLRYEDGVEKERLMGLQAVEKAKDDVLKLEALGAEADAYRETLEFMLGRCRKERVEMLEMQKAFEESLAAHSSELELKRGLLQKVTKSKEDELAALAKMTAEVKKQLADMDKKLEGRKQELRLRQEKARLMAANIDLDAAVSAHGKMSAEEERLMLEKLKKISQEAAEIRSSRVRAQAEADAAEAEFNSLRFAAGVQQPPAPAGAAAPSAGSTANQESSTANGVGMDGDEADGGAESLVYAEPDPEAIIARFAALEMEMKQIEAQVTDYSSRLKTLRSRHAYLQSVKQPTARDAKDEADNDLSTIDRLTQKGEMAKRALDTAKEELKEAENVKMQLQQSIAMLTQRLSNIPVPPDKDKNSAHAEDQLVVRRLLEQLSKGLSSPWCRQVHLSLLDAVEKLHALMKTVDAEEANAAYHEARMWLEGTITAADTTVTKPPPSTSPTRPGSRGIALLPPSRGGSRKLTALLGDEEQLEETIEKLVSGNEWSVRVKAQLPPNVADSSTTISDDEGGKHGGASGGTVPARVLTEAAQAFERQLRESVAATLKADDSGAAGAESPKLQGMTSQRSRRRLASDGGPESAAIDGSDAGSTGIGFGRRTSIVGAATAVLKPKPRELTRMFAAALQMSGNEVEEHLMSPARKDPEDVLTRDALKRATKTTIRQMMRSRRAAEAKAAAAGAGGGEKPGAAGDSPRKPGTAGGDGGGGL